VQLSVAGVFNEQQQHFLKAGPYHNSGRKGSRKKIQVFSHEDSFKEDTNA